MTNTGRDEMAKARAGREQLSVWVASACMDALKAKSLETGLPIREIIEKAVADWKPTDVRSDIDDLRDRVGKLEALVQAGGGAAKGAAADFDSETATDEEWLIQMEKDAVWMEENSDVLGRIYGDAELEISHQRQGIVRYRQNTLGSVVEPTAKDEVLEAVVQAGGQAQVNAPIAASPPTEINTVIAELASDGMRQAAIAAELAKRGFTTAAGGAIKKGDSRICKAVKAAKC